nr:MAG TPA: hypothetical protein [Caudoviricetes sp.]
MYFSFNKKSWYRAGTRYQDMPQVLEQLRRCKSTHTTTGLIYAISISHQPPFTQRRLFL